MKYGRLASLAVFATIAVMVSVSGCLSTRNSTLDAIQGAITGSGNEPFVEAFIEYPGPQDKWAGPVGFFLHVTARDNGAATITATPSWFNEKVPAALTVAQRTLASVSGVTSGSARERMNELAMAIQGGGEQKFSGCLSPVRVRLIRGNGALVEKMGCRSETGWPRIASDTVNYFMSAMLYGG